jgi:NACalpha-BTF3-like transcription factor
MNDNKLSYIAHDILMLSDRTGVSKVEIIQALIGICWDEEEASELNNFLEE